MAKIKGASLTFFFQGMGDGRTKIGISTDRVVAVNFWARNSKDPNAIMTRWCLDLRYHGELPKANMRGIDAVRFLEGQASLINEILGDFVFAYKNGIAPDSLGELVNTASPFKIFAWGCDEARRKQLGKEAQTLRSEFKKYLRKLQGKKASTLASQLTLAQKKALNAMTKGKKKKAVKA